MMSVQQRHAQPTCNSLHSAASQEAVTLLLIHAEGQLTRPRQPFLNRPAANLAMLLMKELVAMLFVDSCM